MASNTVKQPVFHGFVRTLLLALAMGLMCGGALAQSSSSGSFNVTILLRTFSEPVTSDHRCTYRGQAGDQKALRLSCPATVDVKAIASAAAGLTVQHLHGSSQGYQDRYRVTSAGKLPSAPIPMELTIAW